MNHKSLGYLKLYYQGDLSDFIGDLFGSQQEPLERIWNSIGHQLNNTSGSNRRTFNYIQLPIYP